MPSLKTWIDCLQCCTPHIFLTRVLYEEHPKVLFGGSLIVHPNAAILGVHINDQIFQCQCQYDIHLCINHCVFFAVDIQISHSLLVQLLIKLLQFTITITSLLYCYHMTQWAIRRNTWSTPTCDGRYIAAMATNTGDWWGYGRLMMPASLLLHSISCQDWIQTYLVNKVVLHYCSILLLYHQIILSPFQSPQSKFLLWPFPHQCCCRVGHVGYLCPGPFCSPGWWD